MKAKVVFHVDWDEEKRLVMALNNMANLPLVPTLCVGMHTGRLCLPATKADFNMTSCVCAPGNRGGASENTFPGRVWERD